MRFSLFLIFALAARAAELMGPPSPVAKLAVEGSFPADLVLERTDLQKVNASDLRGKSLYLHFWDASCEQCPKVLASLYKLKKKTSDVEVYSVILDADIRRAEGVLDAFAPYALFPTVKGQGTRLVTLVDAKPGEPLTIEIGPDGRIKAIERRVKDFTPVPSEKPEITVPAQSLLAVGTIAPDTLPLVGSDGRTPSTLAEYKGRPVLLNFWASWCGPCVRELPGIARASRAYSPRGLIVQLVNVDREWANGKRALQRTIGEGTLPLFLGRGTIWEDRFDMAAIPYTIVLDRNHRIVYAASGMADWEGEEGRRVLEPLL